MFRLNADQLKILNNMIFPEINDPFEFRICWLKASNPRLRSEETGCVPHHHRFYEIHFYLEGEARYVTPQNDIFRIERNQFIIFPPNTMHEKLRGEHNSMYFSLAYELPQQGNTLSEYLCCRQTFVGLIAPDMRDTFMNIVAELDFLSRLTPVILCNFMFNMVYRVCRQANPASGRHGKFDQMQSIDQRVRSSMRFIDDNLNSPMTALTVAEYSRISYKQLNRLFIKELNTTVLRYIHEKKNERAKALLINNDMSLADISRAVGFENEYYFNSFFKKMNGVSPGTFRKEHRLYSKKME
ncbi:MAG: helix-turn-helix domain-containing protein [Eubacteriales bacterium]